MKRKLHYVISSQSVTFGKSEIKQNLWMKIFNNRCSLWNITYRSYYSHWISQPTKLCIFLFTDFHWFTWFWSLPTLKPRVTDFEEETLGSSPPVPWCLVLVLIQTQPRHSSYSLSLSLSLSFSLFLSHTHTLSLSLVSFLLFFSSWIVESKLTNCRLDSPRTHVFPFLPLFLFKLQKANTKKF